MLLKRVLPLFAVLALLGAACGDDDEPAMETGAASGEHNEADIAFAKAMVPHHEQAVTMAGLAKTRASSAEVKDLASRIEAAQGPEIATMQGWLAEWGEEAPGDHSDMGMDMGGMDMEMSGMMSDDEMGMLEGASGADFDRMFLEMMIRHHEGAIEMAETEREEGVYEPATQLAEDIASAQQEEIDEMQGLLAGLQ